MFELKRFFGFDGRTKAGMDPSKTRTVMVLRTDVKVEHQKDLDSFEPEVRVRVRFRMPAGLTGGPPTEAELACSGCRFDS